ncbi:hypothetical protein MS3_00002900 [Schistosoma haematobium]|uniref:Uncharacterized protein n=1 Tax=Schistosoma haematobium TaxID=6185 RepID=A0A095CBM4_SCHHA|nr:hypothetical protein MS3_00002900 [Schistosoma haematobium]KAH9590072.1 hypothetical protein MS3_00002900 [Schistosoma haematobium]CAH8649648.1 unnamed protein product [Schistosoma haematobium]CAH8656721.1 unnamed protein product [Schistosoma haematobium]
MDQFNGRSHRFYSPGVNEMDEENLYPPLSGGLYNHNRLNRMTFFSTTSSNSSLASGLSDTNFINLEQTAATGNSSSSSTTNRFGFSDGLMNHEHTDNDRQHLNVVRTNSSHNSSRFMYNPLNVYDAGENLPPVANSEHYRQTYSPNFIQNTSDSISNDSGVSPYCSIVSFQNNMNGQNFCIDCRYNHIMISGQVCSCNCHNESKEVTTTSILNFSANMRSAHFLNRPLSSDNYPTPTKYSWNSTSSLSESMTHPVLPPLTNALTEQCNHNPVNNHNTFRYFGVSSPITTDNSPSGYDSSNDSPSPSALELTGDVRTVNFVSHDQPPLRT